MKNKPNNYVTLNNILRIFHIRSAKQAHVSRVSQLQQVELPASVTLLMECASVILPLLA